MKSTATFEGSSKGVSFSESPGFMNFPSLVHTGYVLPTPLGSLFSVPQTGLKFQGNSAAGNVESLKLTGEAAAAGYRDDS